jgi:hypothetical protein
MREGTRFLLWGVRYRGSRLEGTDCRRKWIVRLKRLATCRFSGGGFQVALQLGLAWREAETGFHADGGSVLDYS